MNGLLRRGGRLHAPLRRGRQGPQRAAAQGARELGLGASGHQRLSLENHSKAT